MISHFFTAPFRRKGYFISSSCFLIILRTISPPMEPASREVRSPLYPSFKFTPNSEATSVLNLSIAAFASGTSTRLVLPEELAIVVHLRNILIRRLVCFGPQVRKIPPAAAG